MYIQIETVGDQYIARIRTRDTVYLWAAFFTLADARQWANAHLAGAKAMAERRTL
jgi:hypothetical protein